MRWFGFLVVSLLLVSCSDGGDPSGPPSREPVPTTLKVVEGEGLQAPAGTVLPRGPTVELRDQFGKPMAGRTVTFQVLEGGGTAVIASAETDVLGWARGLWILGRTPGSRQRLRASAGSVSVEVEATAVRPTVGEKYSGRENYVDYYAGNLPVVISAPHGGSLRPAEIPDRTWGTTGTDTNTLDLTLKIRQALFERTGGWAHVVISNLARIKLDPNREIVEAAQGNPQAQRAWWEYHTYIEEARRRVQEEFGEGLYLDIHGHGHAIPRLELGYMLTNLDLSYPDEVLNGSTYVAKSSVKALAQKPGKTLAEVVRGPLSLGTLMEARGYPAVPSQGQTWPNDPDFYSGGYSTARHGSRDGGTVSGVQIEHHFAGVRDTEANRRNYSLALADALLVFFRSHFSVPLAPR